MELRNGLRELTRINVRNPNHHYFSKRLLQYTSNLYYNTPPICIAMLSVPQLSGKGHTSVLLPFVSQCASHLYRNTPPICIAVLLGNLGGCGHRDVPHWPRSLNSSDWRLAIVRIFLPAFSEKLLCSPFGCTPRVSCNNTLLRRVLRRFFKGSASLSRVPRRRLVRVSVRTGVLRRVLRRGGCHRRRLEGRNHVLSQSTNPLRVHPILAILPTQMVVLP